MRKRTIILIAICAAMSLVACEDAHKPDDTPAEEQTTPGAKAYPFKLGIGRTVLWDPSEGQTPQSTLDGIKAAGAASVRLSMNGYARIIQATKEHILYCNSIGLDVLLNISIANIPKSCYEEGTQLSPGDPARKFYSLYPISKAIPEKYEEWITSLLEEFQEAGCRIDAVEVGNEIAWAAFNPDLPITGGVVYDSSYAWNSIPEDIRQGMIRCGELAACTKRAVVKIYGKDAPKVTLGSLNMSENLQYYQNSGGCIVKPLTALQIITGKYPGMPAGSQNWLSSLDGIAIHGYPGSLVWQSDFNAMVTSGEKYLDWLMKGIPELTSLPVYMTEIGFRYSDAGIGNDWMRTDRFLALFEAMRRTQDKYHWAQLHVYSWDQGDYALFVPKQNLLLDAGQNIFKTE